MADDVALRIEHAFLFKGKDERDFEVGCQCLGSLGGHGVGIGVKHLRLAVVCEGSHHRNDTLFDEQAQPVGVDTVDVAHISIVDTIC